MRSALLLLVLVSAPVAQDQLPLRSQLPPNIVVILSDDAGYADFSVHGNERFPTPRIDSLATRGVRCSQGYVSAAVCSPSRAGLLTGRYQQRFGHEFNVPPRYSETNGMALEERTLADLLNPRGYRSVALGKWHLGYAPHFHPLERGFDDYYGFLQGSRSYRAIEGNRLNRLLRDREPVLEEFDYMTDELGRGAAAYIAEHAQQPFFLYLAFNAVHGPMHATEADLAQVGEHESQRRSKLAAMTVALDRAVGAVLDALTEHELDQHTLVVFLNDNGGATNNASSNAPLRAHKGTPFEGGLRVPFLLRWDGILPAGSVYDEPVSSLDLVASALAAAGVEAPAERPLDGVDLLPFLTGQREGPPHELLYWRRGDSWAVRQGPWKLLHYSGKHEQFAAPGPQLYHLEQDPGELLDRAAAEPERVAELQALWASWSAELDEPRWR